MDRTEIYIYRQDIRLRRVFLSESIKRISGIRNFTDRERGLFAFPALLAAALASEIKDDDGSMFVSLKTPEDRKCYTAICETDGRLRGYAEVKQPDPLTDSTCLLTVGRRLAVRGDYTSTVTAATPVKAAEAYFVNSNQTKASLSMFAGGETSALYLAEYIPGHDVNTEAADNEEQGDRKEELNLARTAAEKGGEALEEAVLYAEIPVEYGCTCSKRKLHRILEAQGIILAEGLEAECRLCGKKYIF